MNFLGMRALCLENSYTLNSKFHDIIDIYPTLGITLHWQVLARWLPECWFSRQRM